MRLGTARLNSNARALQLAPANSRIASVRVLKKITVLLVDDHKLVRAGFRRIIEDEDDLVVIGETGDGTHAIQMARELAPTVALMDCSLPGINGLLAAQRMIASSPRTAVLMVSMHADDGHIAQALRVGARGYIVKNAEDIHLVSAIRRVVAGDLVFPAAIMQQLETKVPPERTLSARELEIVQLIAEGKSNKQIAAQLGLSINTVAAHRGNIMKTLRVHKTADLVKYAIRNGLAGIA
ncbi:MAG: response regulator transcription factor [Candidatus Acidiferrum sp.]|jgi:DNA-binding NarL/FixJ family response regulator